MLLTLRFLIDCVRTQNVNYRFMAFKKLMIYTILQCTNTKNLVGKLKIILKPRQKKNYNLQLVRAANWT